MPSLKQRLARILTVLGLTLGAYFGIMNLRKQGKVQCLDQYVLPAPQVYGDMLWEEAEGDVESLWFVEDGELSLIIEVDGAIYLHPACPTNEGIHIGPPQRVG